MQYILLVYVDEKRFAALPQSEQERVHDDCVRLAGCSGNPIK